MNTTKMVYRTFMITGAVALTCTPAAIAISGSASAARDNAAAAQYGTEDKGPVAAPTTGGVATPDIEVKPTVTSNPPTEEPTPEETTPPGTTGGPGPDSGTTPTTREQGTTPSQSSLPFTGGPVLPLVLGAVALLGAGAVLRRVSGPRTTD